MSDNQETLPAFIARNQLTFQAVRVPARTDGCMSDMRGASHFLCVIGQEGKGNPATLATFYSMGSAHKTAPRLADVLDSLATDSSMAESSFADWCGECGYDADSRKAFATFEACQEIAAKLLALLGRVEFNNLLQNVERL